MRANHKQIILESFFDGDEGLADRFLSQFSSVGLKNGEELITTGDESDDVYVLVKGKLKAQISDADGNSLWLGDFAEGDILGEMSSLGQQTRSASVVAVGAARVYGVPAESFLQIMTENGKLATRVACNMAARLRQTNRRIWETSVLKIKGRVHAELIRIAERQGRANWPDSGPEIEISSIQDLADHICCPRENVSRALTDLARENQIERLDAKYFRLHFDAGYEFPTVKI